MDKYNISMPEANLALVVRKLWEHFQARNWHSARQLLDDNFIAEWPHSGERIRGADNFIALNEHFPGAWSIIVYNVICQGDTVVSQVSVPTPGATFECASVFTLRDGRIWRVTEYWVERSSEKPPAWRRRWSEPL